MRGAPKRKTSLQGSGATNVLTRTPTDALYSDLETLHRLEQLNWDRYSVSLNELQGELQFRRDMEIVQEEKDAVVQRRIDDENAAKVAEAARVRKAAIDREVSWLADMKAEREQALEDNTALQDTVIVQARDAITQGRYDHAVRLLSNVTFEALRTLGTEAATRTAIWLTRCYEANGQVAEMRELYVKLSGEVAPETHKEVRAALAAIFAVRAAMEFAEAEEAEKIADEERAEAEAAEAAAEKEKAEAEAARVAMVEAEAELKEARKVGTPPHVRQQAMEKYVAAKKAFEKEMHEAVEAEETAVRERAEADEADKVAKRERAEANGLDDTDLDSMPVVDRKPTSEELKHLQACIHSYWPVKVLTKPRTCPHSMGLLTSSQMMQNPTKVLPMLLRAPALMNKEFGHGSPELAEVCVMMHEVYCVFGDFKKACAAATQAEKLLADLKGDEDDNVRESLAVLIEANVKLNNMSIVEDLCLRGEEGLMRRAVEGLGGQHLENVIGQYL